MEGQQQQRAADVKAQMQVGDGAHIHHVIPEGDREKGVADIEDSQEESSSDDIEQQMDHSRPLGVPAGADGGEDGGDAGADILTHDEGNGGVKIDQPRRTHRLENAHGGRRALEKGGDGGAHQDAQQRIGEG